MDKIKNDRQLAITQDRLARARRSLASVITKIPDPARRDLLVESIEMTIRRLESEIKEYLAQKGKSQIATVVEKFGKRKNILKEEKL